MSRRNSYGSIHKDDTDADIMTSSVPQVNHDFKLIGALKSHLMINQYQGFWPKVAILVSSFVVGFAYMLDGTLRGTFTGYAVGAYGMHSALSTINVVTTIIAAAGQVLFARLTDTFGRSEMYLISIVLYVVGTVIQSQATSVARYAAGAIIYQLGYVGVVLILMVMLSDFSSMRLRLLFMLSPTFGYIIVTWVSGNILTAVNAVEHWSWGIGMWAFIFPLANIPFLFCLGHMWFKARKLTEWKNLKGSRTRILKEQGIARFVIQLFWELDVVGSILLAVTLGCILVPLTLAGGVQSKWREAHIIAPLVIGVVLVPVFLAWEAFVAKFPLAPMIFFLNRGIWCPLAISFTFMLISMLVSEYLYTILIVAVNDTATSAQRIISLNSFTAEIVGFFYGLLVMYIRRLKPGIIFGTSMWFVALGLMYHYRGGTHSKPGIIGAEVVLGFATGFFTYPITVVMQSHLSHDYLAVVTGMGLTLYRIGGAVGSAVGGAIWTQILYDRLSKKLPSDVAAGAFGDPFNWALKHPWGTPERQDAVEEFQYVQRILITAGIAFTAPLVLFAIFTKDRKLSNAVTVDEESNPEEDEADWNILGYFKKSKRQI